MSDTKPILVRFRIAREAAWSNTIMAKSWIYLSGRGLSFQRKFDLVNANASLVSIETAFKSEAMRRLARKVPGRELVADGMKPVTWPVEAGKKAEQEEML